MTGSCSLALLLASALHLPQDQPAGSGTPPRPVWTLPIVVARYFPVQGDRVDVSVTGDWGESLEATRQQVSTLLEAWNNDGLLTPGPQRTEES